MPECNGNGEKIRRRVPSGNAAVGNPDRGLRAGAMFSDLELIGIPWRVVVSTRLLEQDTLEYQGRHEPKATVKARHAVFQELLQHLA